MIIVKKEWDRFPVGRNLPAPVVRPSIEKGTMRCKKLANVTNGGRKPSVKKKFQCKPYSE